MHKSPSLTIVALLLAATPLGAATPKADVDVDAARALFAAYEAGEAAFDPAVADLYCDTALIVDRQTLADGGIRELTLSAKSRKAAIRAAMPAAQARGERNDYRDVVFVAVDGGVRITATRHSLPADTDSPVSLRVGDCAGKPAIVEELSHSQG
jgi:hypothetical protein